MAFNSLAIVLMFVILSFFSTAFSKNDQFSFLVDLSVSLESDSLEVDLSGTSDENYITLYG